MLIEYKIRFLPDGVVVSQNIDGNPPDQDGPGAGGGDDGPPLDGNPPDGDGPGAGASASGSAVQAVILGSVIIGRASSAGAKPPKPVALKKKR